MAVLPLLLMLLARPAAGAPCPELLNAIRQQAWERGSEVSCAELQAAARLLPLEEGSAVQGEWDFAGEKALRADLEGRGVPIPADLIPLGFLERSPPGAKALLAVFALSVERLSALLELARVESAPRDRLAQVLGRGAAYDRLGLFAREPGQPFPTEGRWLSLRGGLWSQHAPAPEGLANCLPCAGWLCPEAPAACLSDMDYDGLPELHLAEACPRPPCGMRVVSAAGGRARVLASSADPGDWEERRGRWFFKPRPRCSGGDFCAADGDSLGDPTCVRPRVLRLDARGDRLVPEPSLRDEAYPVREEPLPRRCRGGRRGTVVWTQEGGFVKYR